MKQKIVVTLALSWLALAATASAQEWTVLFDGKSTDQLRGYKMEGFPDKGWKVEAGALKTMVGGTAVDLITKDKFQNFEFEVEWKTSPGGNSGIIYNVLEGPSQTYETGPEMQVLDDEEHPDGKTPKTTAGALYALIAPSANKKLKPVGDWNQARLVIKNKHVEHWLNGVKIVEYEWGSDELKALIAKSKFKDMPFFAKSNEGGHVALQYHGQEVWYRNLKIRKL